MTRMCAVILEINRDNLLVQDSETNQEVLVHTNCTCNLNVNDRILILYNGIMTMSIPPQINAVRISRMPFNRCPR